MTDDTDEDAEADATYDPSSPTAPERQPPLRSTAPQSEYNLSQVGFGLVVLLVGVAVTFGIPFLLA